VVLVTNKDFIRHSLLCVLKEEIKAAEIPEEEIKATEVPEEENLSEAPADEEWTDCPVKKANGAETIASRQSTEDK